MPMRRLIGASRYLAMIGIVFGLLACLVAFVWVGGETIAMIIRLLHGDTRGVAVQLVQTMDRLLVAAALLIFAVGLYGLFIGPTSLPSHFETTDLDSLKAKLAGIVSLAMGVSFLEKLETNDDPHDILYRGIATALVSGALLVMNWLARRRS
jgi:uncharacterized membrane protein YqhA